MMRGCGMGGVGRGDWLLKGLERLMDFRLDGIEDVTETGPYKPWKV
jgi:hypothetical protein